MSSIRGQAVFILVACLHAALCEHTPNGGKHGFMRATGRTISVQELKASLKVSLETALSDGASGMSHRLSLIEAGLQGTFRSLPKNEFGRLSPQAVRHLAHHYFGKEHGWLIKGLEPHSMSLNLTEVHEMTILQDKAPALVEALLEDRQSGRGLLLSDVVTLVAALERLIFDESIKLLVGAYSLNEFSVAELLDEVDLHEVLKSYLIEFGSGSRANLNDTRTHWITKVNAEQIGGHMQELFDFGKDTLLNFGYSRRNGMNPFEPQRYSFEAASQIIETMAQGYGKVQNADCRVMKNALMELDSTGSGRVPLGAFYSAPPGSGYNFSESTKYLRDIGALDESVPHSPRVRIANYVLGPSNCIASSTYYSVCCLSECEELMSELEGFADAPSVPAEQLLGFVSNLSSSSLDAPRQIPHFLTEQLWVIANRHGGKVPLHGRLFAQWLHYAFPNECPFPQLFENTATLLPEQWSSATNSASREEAEAIMTASRDMYIEEGLPISSDWSQWRDEEVLPFYESPTPVRGMVGKIARVAMQMAAFMMVLRAALSAWQNAARASSGGHSFAKKCDAHVSTVIV